MPGAKETALREFHYAQKQDRVVINPTPGGELATEHALGLRGSEGAKLRADLSSGASPIASFLESLLQGPPGQGPGLGQGPFQFRGSCGD